MADEPDLTEVTIRHRVTGEERSVTKHSLPFFPEWERIDSKGRAVSPSTQKEN